jgi:hydroxylamine reductase
MFCYQCEQTSKGTGCSSFGVCGKDPEAAALQDMIFHAAKGAAMYLHRARRYGAVEAKAEYDILESIFLTITDTNFDTRELERALEKQIGLRDKAKQTYEGAARRAGASVENLGGPAAFVFGKGISELYAQADEVSIEKRIERFGEDHVAAQEFLAYGIKGMAAYAWHAFRFGKESSTFPAFLSEALSAIADENLSFEQLMKLCVRCGEENLKVLECLDNAHTERFGHPEPTDVRVSSVKGKAILVSGHSMDDLESLLQKTSVNVYTHGELLPAHAYPRFKKYPHLIGNYGGAWQDQAREFDAFPGPIVVTTNCLQKPLASYARRMFTTGPAGWPGVRHLDGKNWQEVIEAALVSTGFKEDAPEKRIHVGYGHKALNDLTDKMASLIKSGELKTLYLVGGCDGSKLGRSHYSDLTSAVAPNGMILTFACGKYRFNKQDFGRVHDMPKLLDVGQCNDAYSLIRFLTTLSQKMKVDVGQLPIEPVLSWFEQKSIAYMLSMMAVGVRNIQLGPTLPAFFSPAVYSWLNKNFGLREVQPLDKARVAAILT